MKAREQRPEADEQVSRAGEEERRRWARDLHDRTLQGLAAIRIELNLALDADEERRRAVIERAIQSLEEEVDALRDLIAELRPGEDSGDPLPQRPNP